MVDDVRRAFGMGGDRRARVLRLELQQLGLREGLVDDADARPQQHLAAGLAGEIAAEMLVRAEDDLLVERDLVLRIVSADELVTMMSLSAFHRGRAVDVGERDMVRVRGAEGRELLGRAAVLEAAAGIHVGQDDDLVGRQDLRGLRHEADAAEGDHVGVGRLRLAREIEAVADEIGEVLDVGLLVIMGEDDGIALLAEAVDLGAQVEALEAEIGCVH
jgi:hypothetical protein